MENMELLAQVIKNRLERSLTTMGGTEEESATFKEAMEAIDRYNEMKKIETAEKEQKPNRVIKIVEVAVIPIALSGLGFIYKKNLSKIFMAFEKDDSFTSTPGRSTSSWFKF